MDRTYRSDAEREGIRGQNHGKETVHKRTQELWILDQTDGAENIGPMYKHTCHVAQDLMHGVKANQKRESVRQNSTYIYACHAYTHILHSTFGILHLTSSLFELFFVSRWRFDLLLVRSCMVIPYTGTCSQFTAEFLDLKLSLHRLRYLALRCALWSFIQLFCLKSGEPTSPSSFTSKSSPYLHTSRVPTFEENAEVIIEFMPCKSRSQLQDLVFAL